MDPTTLSRAGQSLAYVHLNHPHPKSLQSFVENLWKITMYIKPCLPSSKNRESILWQAQKMTGRPCSRRKPSLVTVFMVGHPGWRDSHHPRPGRHFSLVQSWISGKCYVVLKRQGNGMLTVPSLTNISLGPCLVQLRLQREKQDITQNRVWNIGYLDLLHIYGDG